MAVSRADGVAGNNAALGAVHANEPEHLLATMPESSDPQRPQLLLP